MALFSWSSSKREEDGVLPTGGTTTLQQQQQQQQNLQRRHSDHSATGVAPPQGGTPSTAALAAPPTSSAYIHQAGEGLIPGTLYHSEGDRDDDGDQFVGDRVQHETDILTFSIFTPAKPQKGKVPNDHEGWSEDEGWDDSVLETSAEAKATAEPGSAHTYPSERAEDNSFAVDPIVEQEGKLPNAFQSSKATTTVRFADEQHAASEEDTADEIIPSSPPLISRHHNKSDTPQESSLVPLDTTKQHVRTSQDSVLASTTSTALAKPSTKFVFLSEEGSVPSQLHKLEETSMRRRQEFQSNVYDLELRVAALTAALARERMDREKSLHNLLPDHIYRPLQEAMEDLSFQRDEARNAENSGMKLEGRLSVLNSHMTHSTHVDLEDAKLDKLDRLKDRIEQQVEPSMQMQSHKLDKREGSLFRKLEDLAGSMARKYQEERATRVAATRFVSSQVKTMQALDKARADAYIEQCREVTQQLQDEKHARQQQDVYMSRLVAKQEALMKQALLEAVGGEHLHE